MPGRQLGEGGVGRREDRERARAFERIDQAGGLKGSGECGEVTGANGGVDDVGGHGLGVGEAGGSGSRGDAGEEGQGQDETR